MDTFTCGICNEVTSTVLEFLLHKSQHAGPGAGICCEFCKISYTRKVTLLEHYRVKHRVIFNADRKKCDNQPENNNERTKKPRKYSKNKKEDSPQNETETLGADENPVPNIPSQLLNNLTDDLTVSNCVNDISDAVVNDSVVSNIYVNSENIIPIALEKNAETSEVLHKSCARTDTATNTLEKVEGVPNALLALDDKVENVDSCGKLDFVSNLDEQHMQGQDVSKQGTDDKSPDDTEAEESDFHFILITNIKEGASMNYGKLAYKCLHCDYQTDWKASISRHMKQKHSELLTLHKKIKVVNEDIDGCKIVKMSEYSISQAKLKTKNGMKRIRPVEKQDLVGHFVCPKCNKIFNRLRYLRKHIMTHRTEDKFLCDECGKSFKTQSYLTNHRKIHKREAYSCKQCDFTSTISSVIQAHRQLHSEGCVICDTCGLAYMDKSTLMKHKQVHDSSRPFACNQPGCTWRFKTEKMCRAHIKNHTSGSGKFECLKCGYVFRHKHHLKRHELKMHGIQQPKIDKDLKLQEVSKSDLCIEQMDTVNLIVDPDIQPQQYHLEAALQNSQLVIATDEDGNAVNYEVTDIAMSAAYQKLLQGSDSQTVESHTVLIPHPDDEEIVLEHDNTILSEEPSDIETVTCSIGNEIAV